MTEVAARRFGAVSSAAAVVLVVLAVLLAVASVPLYALTHQDWQVNGGQNIAVAVLFSAVGFVIVRRQPRNAIGWILLTAPAGLLVPDRTGYTAASRTWEVACPSFLDVVWLCRAAARMPSMIR